MLPPLRKTRRGNLARLVGGLYRAKHVHLSAIADEVPGGAQQTSKTRRLRRFLANEAVDPHACYRPVARHLLQEAAASGPLRLLVDTLALTGRRRVRVAALAYRRRALPVLWQVDRKAGVTSGQTQADFLAALTDRVPAEADVVLIGDGEFHSVDLLRTAQEAGWDFCVRLHADTYVRACAEGEALQGEALQGEALQGEALQERGSWRECRALDPEEGGRRVVRPVRVTKAHAFGPVDLVYRWADGEEEPWRLVTNLIARSGSGGSATRSASEAGRSAVRMYERRMWIEELFGDWQEEGFHLNRTRLYAPDRLERLLLGLSLVYVWLIAVASYVVKRGWRARVDRTDRRDRSYLTIGWRWVYRCLRNRKPPPLRYAPYF